LGEVAKGAGKWVLSQVKEAPSYPPSNDDQARGAQAMAGGALVGSAFMPAGMGGKTGGSGSEAGATNKVDSGGKYSVSTTESDIHFYVNTQGVALPATGYRYMDSQYFALTQDTMSAPLSYFGFRAYSSGATARDGFQIFYEYGNSASWSDARLRGEFDTLQLFGPEGFVNATVPLANGGKGPGLEPFTSTYPQYGAGGQAQLVPLIPGSKVQFRKITVLPSE